MSALSRRAVLRGVAWAGMGVGLAHPVHARALAGRVVVIGGGFAGATAARSLKALAPKLDVTLVEADKRYIACPLSNEVITGARDFERQVFTYDHVVRAGVKLRFAQASAVEARHVVLAGGQRLPFDRAILAPGIDLAFDTLPGYDPAAAELMPHAWKAGAQTKLLARRLEALDDGANVIMTVPAAPYRCPPGPYERASLIAHVLKTRKPRSKIIVLDAKDAFSKQKLFQEAWAALYPDHLEWVGLAQGGNVSEVVASENLVRTDFGDHRGGLINVVPPQRAGAIAKAAGVADRSGWCPIDPSTFESRLRPNLHVIGDAAIAGAMPKSAFAANDQAKVCAQAVVDLLHGDNPVEPRLVNTCYSLVAPDYGISIAGVYRPKDGVLADVPGAGGTSPLGASSDIRATEAANAHAWFEAISDDVFG